MYELSLFISPVKYLHQNYQVMAKEIRDFYFSKTDGQVNADSVLEFNDLLTDAWFAYTIENGLKIQLKRSTGNVFYYLFSLDTKLNGRKLALSQNADRKFPGASHADDLYYVFYETYGQMDYFTERKQNDQIYNHIIFICRRDEYSRNLYANLANDSVELKGVRLVASLWTNFAKYG